MPRDLFDTQPRDLLDPSTVGTSSFEAPPPQQAFDMFGRQYDVPAGAEATFNPLAGLEIVPTIASSAAAELPAGLAGLATLPFGGVKKAAQVVEDVQSALTVRPQTDQGRAFAQDVGKAFQPVDDFLKGLGKSTLEATGSPELAALAETGPYMALELLGFKGASAARGSRKVLGLTDDMVDTLKRGGKTVDDLSPDDVAKLQKTLLDEQAVRQQRRAILDDVGIDEPTRAQLTRNADDFQLQQELAKTNTDTRIRLERQEGQLLDAINSRQAATGGEGVSSVSSAIDEVTNRSVLLDRQVSQAYQLAREAAPGEKIIRFDRLSEVLRQSAPSNEISKGLVKAVRGHMKQNGMINKKFQPTGKIDLEAAENLRIFINSQFNSTSDVGRQFIHEFKNALDEDVFAAIPDNELFVNARRAKIDFERGLDRAKISKFDARKTNLVRDMLDNKIDPDNFVQDVVFRKKYRADDVQQLGDYLQQTPNGSQAWDDLRAQTFEEIKRRIFVGPVDANNVQALSRAQLDSTLRSIGGAKRQRIFTPLENEFLDNLLEAAKLREPVRGTALGRGPSAQAIGKLERSLEKVPLARMLVEIKEVIDNSGNVKKTLQPGLLTAPDLSTRARSGLSGQAAVGGTIQNTLLQEEQDNQ